MDPERDAEREAERDAVRDEVNDGVMPPGDGFIKLAVSSVEGAGEMRIGGCCRMRRRPDGPGAASSTSSDGLNVNSKSARIP